MADLKRVYAAIDEDNALQELERFDEIWGGKYPKIADNWRDKWVHLSTYFKYPQAVRTLIYAMMDITKNGPVAVVIGARFILSWRYFLLIESAIDNC